MGTCRVFEQPKAAWACAVFERFGGLGFVVYFLIIGGLSLAVVNVAAHLAESTFQGLTIKKSETSQSSRVELALAKGLDTAESRPLAPVTKVNVWPNRPRVEGWTKRAKGRGVADENTGRMILRSLRGEM